MRYSIEPRDRVYVKGYGFLSFAKNIGKNMSNKYSQKRLDSTKKSTKRAIKKTIEATGDLISNKIADKIISISKKSLQNDEANNKMEIPRKRYISPEKRQQIIDELRSI